MSLSWKCWMKSKQVFWFNQFYAFIGVCIQLVSAVTTTITLMEKQRTHVIVYYTIPIICHVCKGPNMYLGIKIGLLQISWLLFIRK